MAPQPNKLALASTSTPTDALNRIIEVMIGYLTAAIISPSPTAVNELAERCYSGSILFATGVNYVKFAMSALPLPCPRNCTLIDGS